MKQNETVLTPFRWSKVSETAALLLAEDELPDAEIAGNLGIARVTLFRWKTNPEFASRVKSHVEAYREAVLARGIARRERRVARLDRTWDDLQTIIAARAKYYQQQQADAQARADALRDEGEDAKAAREMLGLCFHPGMETGWLIVQSKQFGIDILLDTGTESALRALEVQAAKETGQWVEKAQVETRDVSISESLERKLSGLRAASDGNLSAAPDGNLSGLAAGGDAAGVPQQPDP